MTDRQSTQLAEDLDRAWRSLDLEEILSLHHEDATFQAVGETPVFEAKKALRQVYASTIHARPGLRFEPRAVYAGDDWFVVETTMYAGEGEPTLERPLVDVYTVKDGLVLSKRSYIAPDQRH